MSDNLDERCTPCSGRGCADCHFSGQKKRKQVEFKNVAKQLERQGSGGGSQRKPNLEELEEQEGRSGRNKHE